MGFFSTVFKGLIDPYVKSYRDVQKLSQDMQKLAKKANKIKLSRYFNGLAERSFENGISLKTKTIPSLKSVSISIKIEAGANQDIPGKEGTAHALEHMAPQDPEFREQGGTRNLTTRFDSTEYAFSMPWENVAKTDWMLSRIYHQVFGAKDARQFEKEQNVIGRELDEDDDSLGVFFMKHLNGVAFAGPDWGGRILGKESLATLTMEDLEDFKNRHYVGWNITIEMMGPINPGSMYDLVKRHFADIPAGEPVTVAPAPDYKGGYRHIPASQRLTEVYIALFDPETTKISMGQFVLAEYLSRSLYDTLRGNDSQGLAYEASSIWQYCQGRPLLTMMTGFKPEDAAIVMPKITNILGDVAQGKIDPSLWRQAVGTIRLETLERYDDKQLLPKHFESPLEIDQKHKEEIAELEAVRPEKLTLMIRRLVAQNPTLIVMGNVGTMMSYENFKISLAEAAKVKDTHTPEIQPVALSPA